MVTISAQPTQQDSYLSTLLTHAMTIKASDLHIVAGRSPHYRINTILQPVDSPVVTQEQAAEMVLEMLGPERYEEFLNTRDADFSTALPGVGRFRVNAHWQKDVIGIAFRAIPNKVPVLGQLNLPPVVARYADLPRGLVLVTGDTGSGKSTTLAAIVDHVNQSRDQHIITLEDPIEYSLESKRCLVEQREIGSDCLSFGAALRHVVRQDPDVILVGEMRDLETVGAAVTAAETGHFVLSTLHTIDATSTIERIIDFFPPGQQEQIRAQLANTLKGVISQTLFPRIDEPGMVPACEVLVVTPAVRNCIREKRLFEIPNIITTNRALGMQSLDSSITELYLSGYISRESALAQAANPDRLAQTLPPQQEGTPK
jgi:twitching motility protein PilT